MGSVYELRLELLFSGYVRGSTICKYVPESIGELCLNWVGTKVEITAEDYSIRTNSVHVGTYISLQIHLNGFASNILDDRHVKHYKIKTGATSSDANSNGSGSSEFLTKKVYPVRCLSFIGVDFGVRTNGKKQMHITAVDYDDRVIGQTDISVTSGKRNIMQMNMCHGRTQSIWEKYIVPDEKADSTVDVNEWTAALRKLDILQNDYDRQRIFYFVLFKAGCERNVMEYTHFEQVFDGFYEDYSGPLQIFPDCIYAFTEKFDDFDIVSGPI